MEVTGVRSLRSSVGFSLALHALLALLCILLLRYQPAIQPHQTTWIELEPDVAKKFAQHETDLRKQLVQTVPGKRVQITPKEAFLGEHNQEVDRETVSRSRTTVMGHESKTPSLANKQESEKNNHVAAVPKVGVLSTLGLPVLPKVIPNKPVAPEEDAQWAEQGSMPQDWVKGMKESDHTALNTKEYVFYSYFQRIRSRLDHAWVPILREKLTRMYRTGRSLASDMDHTTKVVVVLDDRGEIVKVSVIDQSGTADLDDAAVRAFNLAGPFPNPPKGIIDASGKIEIPWEFILKT